MGEDCGSLQQGGGKILDLRNSLPVMDRGVIENTEVPTRSPGGYVWEP